MASSTRSGGCRPATWAPSSTRSADCRALHRRRPSPRGERDARASRRSPGEMRARPTTFLAVAFPARPDADPAVPPRGEGPRRSLRRRRSSRVSRAMTVSPGGPTPAAQGDVSMYLAGVARRSRCGARAGDAAPADRLDVSLLHDQVLAPLLGDRRPADRQADRLRRRHPRSRGAEPRGRSGPARPSRSRCRPSAWRT